MVEEYFYTLSTIAENCQIKMLTKTKSLSALAATGLLLGCFNVTDKPPPTPASSQVAAPQPAASSTGAVRINGLAQFRQSALVVTDHCRSFSYETDRRGPAQTAIDRALQGYASAFPDGLLLDVQSLKVRMRCHTAGAGAIRSYCSSDASLSLVATGRDRSGREITVTVSKDDTEQVQMGLVLAFMCADGMPAITSAVDGVLAKALAAIQDDLTARTGLPAQ